MASRTSAFTLIEMMVVLVIIGILLALAIPGYEFARRRQVMSQAQQALAGAEAVAERLFGATFSYPAALPAGALVPLRNVTLSYSVIDGKRGYTTKAIGTGNNRGIVALANSSIRCACNDCPVSGAFDDSSRVCPSGYTAW